MPDIEIRYFDKANAAAIARIMTEAMHFKNTRGDDAWGDTPWEVTEILGFWKPDTSHEVWIDNQLVAGFRLIWDDPQVWGQSTDDAGFLHSLAISDAYRGQDIGGKIIDWAADTVKRAGRQYLRLDCPAANTRLCDYYKKQHFTLVAVSQNREGADRIQAFFERQV